MVSIYTHRVIVRDLFDVCVCLLVYKDSDDLKGEEKEEETTETKQTTSEGISLYGNMLL